MNELSEFYDELDFNFEELQSLFDEAKKSRKGTMDEIFKIDKFIDLCRWFLTDAKSAIDKLPDNYFSDREAIQPFYQQLSKIVDYVNVPFFLAMRQRWEIWEKLKEDVPILLSCFEF